MANSAPITITVKSTPPPTILPYVIASAVIGALLLVGFLAFRKK